MKNYGAIRLTVASPPQSFTEPITVSEAAKFLELPERNPPDEQEDALLSLMISAARKVAEDEYGRDLIPKQYDLNLDDFCTQGYFYLSAREQTGYGVTLSEISLPEPLISVDLFRYRDSDGTLTTLVEDSDFIVDTARSLVMPPYGGSWPSFTPWPSSAVLLRFTSGYSSSHPFWLSDGKRLLLGMRQLISAWYTGRLPFEPGSAIQEHPYAVTSLFNYGAKRRVI
jgi:hypothetical protein